MNSYAIDNDYYVKHIATIKSAIPITIEREQFEIMINIGNNYIEKPRTQPSTTACLIGASGMGHLDPKQHLINKPTYR